MVRKTEKLRNKSTPQETVEMEEILKRISCLTSELLEQGGAPFDITFALSTVAADMGIQVTGDITQVTSVLLKAIDFQYERRVEANQVTDNEIVSPDVEEILVEGATIH